jgi:glyoxylase-like metal-dependent hydrolase (beta-lactamase superfamily II)
MRPEVTALFDEATNTISYVVVDPSTKRCAVIDSVLDYDPDAARTDKRSANQIIDFVRSHGLEVEWVLETHVHADHLSAAPYIKQELGGKLAIGSEIVTVQNVFGKIFNAGTEFQRDGRQFDVLFRDGDTFRLGEIPARVMHTPGHTPADMTYVIGDAAFVGDTLFMPDAGTARVATRTSCSSRPGGSCTSCPTRRGCSCATTTRRRAATNTGGRPRSARRGATTSTCAKAAPRTSSSPCAPRVTRPSACRA